MAAVSTTTPRMRRHRDVQEEAEASCKATEDCLVFDAAKPPPFCIADVRAAVPAHCWHKSPWRSLSYVARDVAAVAGLAAAAAGGRDSWPVWAHWAAQGTMFWALFVCFFYGGRERIR